MPLDDSRVVSFNPEGAKNRQRAGKAEEPYKPAWNTLIISDELSFRLRHLGDLVNSEKSLARSSVYRPSREGWRMQNKLEFLSKLHCNRNKLLFLDWKGHSSKANTFSLFFIHLQLEFSENHPVLWAVLEHRGGHHTELFFCVESGPNDGNTDIFLWVLTVLSTTTKNLLTWVRILSYQPLQS